MATSQQPLLFHDYDGFVQKFKPKKTTDDCYTPAEIYDVIADWVTEKYDVPRDAMVRPFYPGGDYEAYDYPDGCCVVDNPPFSILSKIVHFYLLNDVRFFLFCPTLTNMSWKDALRVTHVITDAKITYENGAVVPTSFTTNMNGDTVAVSEPDLSERINIVNDRLRRRRTKKLPKYDYPNNVLTTAKLQWLAKHGQRLEIRAKDCVKITRLDASPNGIYGGGVIALHQRGSGTRGSDTVHAQLPRTGHRQTARRATVNGPAIRLHRRRGLFLYPRHTGKPHRPPAERHRLRTPTPFSRTSTGDYRTLTRNVRKRLGYN